MAYGGNFAILDILEGIEKNGIYIQNIQNIQLIQPHTCIFIGFVQWTTNYSCPFVVNK